MYKGGFYKKKNIERKISNALLMFYIVFNTIMIMLSNTFINSNKVFSIIYFIANLT